MKKIKFSFQREWMDNNKKQYGNPIRQLEKFIVLRNLTFLKSDYLSITVEIEDEKCEEEIDIIIGHIKKQYEIENPWEEVTISGDLDGLEKFVEQRKKTGYVLEVQDEKEESARQETVEKKEVQTEEAAKESEQKENATKTPVRESESKETTTEESVRDSGENVKATETQPVVVKVPEQKKEELSREISIRNSSSMTDYLEELNRLIPMLCKMGAEQCVWSQNLLVSIDDGFGYSVFLKEIANVYGSYRLADKKEATNWVKELKVAYKENRENKYEDWEYAIDYAKNCAKANEGLNKRVIISLDITEWQNELNTEKIQKYLYALNDYTSKVVCVFRVPYMEASVLQKLNEVLSDVMFVRLVSVPAVPLEKMVDYIKGRVKDLRCDIDDKCDRYLEQLILREKSDDSFYGYKTLDKLAKQLIYKKALKNCEIGEFSNLITEEDLQDIFKEENDENPYDALNKLIGIASVKQQIGEIVAQIKTHKQLTNSGAEIERPCIHMMFTGNPGTGKTTVARILSRILKEEGILRKGLLVEVQGRNLCGRYVGETAPRTSAICRDAYGSVLFIDEAYSLARRDNDRDYGKEAIQTLIAEMENHRDDFCVILAGYKNPMYELMELNSGLKSRIPYEIEFPNYTREELTEIFFSMINGKFEYAEELHETVKIFFDSISDEVLSGEEFSNARMVRNLYERVWGKAAYRCSLNGEEKIAIQKEDFQYAAEMTEFKNLVEEKGKRRIGFFE